MEGASADAYVENFDGRDPGSESDALSARGQPAAAQLDRQFYAFERARLGGTYQRSTTILVLISFVFLYGRPQELLPPVGSARLPMIAAIVAGLAWSARIKDTWTFSTRMMFVFLGGEAVRCIFGKMIIDSFVVNDYWAYHTWKDLVLQFTGLTLPMVALCSNGPSLRRFLKCFLSVGLFLAIYMITHSGVGPGGFLADENDAGFVMLMFLPFLLSIINESRASLGKRLPLLAAVAIMIIAIIATSSRGGLIGLVAVLAVFFLRSKKKIQLIFITALLFCAAYPFLSQKYIAKMRTISATDQGTARIRIHYWKLAFRVFKDPRNTLLGVGLENTQYSVQNYETAADIEEFGQSASGRQTHSLYFEILPDLGLWGVFIYGSILISSYRTNNRLMRQIGRSIRALSAAIYRPPSAPPPDEKLRLQLVRMTQMRRELEYLRPLLFATNISFVAILSAGAFVSVAYYPPFWTIACLSSLFERYLNRLFPPVREFLEILGVDAAPEPPPGGFPADRMS